MIISKGTIIHSIKSYDMITLCDEPYDEDEDDILDLNYKGLNIDEDVC
ncbi:MAG: hypothetical protein WBP88_15330 [Nitrososphaeraceae archaeon]